MCVTNFNELDQQIYAGFAFTRGIVGIAGTTVWKDESFGFFARRHPPYALGPVLEGAPSQEDFLGSFNLWCDGLNATLVLTEIADTGLIGTLRENRDITLPVTAAIDPRGPHIAKITVHGTRWDTAPTMFLYMFVRQRTALAGWLEWGTTQLGCYLTRFRSARAIASP